MFSSRHTGPHATRVLAPIACFSVSLIAVLLFDIEPLGLRSGSLVIRALSFWNRLEQTPKRAFRPFPHWIQADREMPTTAQAIM